MGEFNVEVHAAPLQLQLMMQEVLNKRIDQAKELKPILSGELPPIPPEPIDQDYKMEISGGSSGATFTNPTLPNGSVTLASDERGLLWFDGTVLVRKWSLAYKQKLPKETPIEGFDSKATDKPGSANNDSYLFNKVVGKVGTEYVNDLLGTNSVVNNINILKSAIFVFNPTVASSVNRVSTWYFGKSTKKINAVGFYIFKNSNLGVFTNNAKARLQVVVKQGDVNFVLVNKTLGYNELIKYQTAGYSGNLSNYRHVISFETLESLDADSIFITFFCNEPIWQFLAPNTSLGNGEWNKDGSSYRLSETSTLDTIYSEVPKNDRNGTVNALAVEFYYFDHSIQKTSDFNGDSEAKLLSQKRAKDLKDNVVNYTDDKVFDLNNVVEINPVSNPSPYYLYTGGGAGTHKHIFAWYHNKKDRIISQIGIYAYKNSSILPFSINAVGRIQVLVKRLNGTSEVIGDINLKYADLLKFQGTSAIPNIQDHEFIANLYAPTRIKDDEIIYYNLEVPEGVFYFLSTVTAVGTGDWTNRDNLAERGSDTSPIASTIFVVPNYTGAGAAALLPAKFYNTEKRLKIETLDYAKKIAIKGGISQYFSVDNFPVKVVTSNTYDSTTKEGQDTLMIICHGNGQLSGSMDGADPSATFKTYAKENGISWCVFKMQDSTPIKQGEYWETTSTGWGNPECHRRLKAVYDYLSKNYNFKKLIVLAGQSMGFATAQVADYMGYLPIKDVISIGGVMNGVVGRFSLASTEDRKNQIRSAFNLKNDGSEDNLLSEKSQGYDSWKRNLIGDYKIQKSRLWFLIGTNDDSYAGFGGNTQRDLMISSLQKAGGFMKFQQYADEYHASAELWTKLIELGWVKDIFN